jgi:hypothetical protein
MKFLNLIAVGLKLLFVEIAVVAKMFAEGHVKIKARHLSHREKSLLKDMRS